LNWCLVDNDEMPEWNRSEVFITTFMDYEVDVFTDQLEVVPLFKLPNGDVLLVSAIAYERYWGSPPAKLIVSLFVPSPDIACVFQKYLLEKKVIRNFIFRIPKEIVINPAGQLMIYESLYLLQKECPDALIPLYILDEDFMPNGVCLTEEDRQQKMILWQSFVKNSGVVNRKLVFVPGVSLPNLQTRESCAFGSSLL
jgi:hypothetical protein